VTFAPHRAALPFRDIEDVAAALRRDGGRLTAARRLVLEALFAADGPVSVEQIATGAGGRTPIEPTSVYRNLEKLEELGVVRHVHLGHGPGLYTLAGAVEREYLVCEDCGRVTVADPARLERVRAVIREDLGYEARFGHFPMHGLCPECATRAAPRPHGP
jgi:Fur family ferric uptake transcriptional regulator